MQTRVLIFQSSGHIGGTEMMNVRLCSTINKTKFLVDVAILDTEGEISDQYRQVGLEPHHFHLSQRNVVSVARAIRKLLYAQRYDIIYAFGLRANLLLRLLTVGLPQTRIITAQRSVDGWRRPHHNLIDKLTSRRVAAYIANSNTVAAWLKNSVGIEPRKIITISSGIDPSAYQVVGSSVLRQQCGIEDGVPLIICLANLRRVKNHEFLLAAAQTLVQRNREFHLCLVGTDLLDGYLQEQVTALDLADHVTFLGHRNDVPALLATSDIKVLVSTWEGLPGAIMEAMAAGLPVIATDVGGVSELVVDDETGILLPSNDLDALVAAFERLLSNPTLRAKMGQAGRERITQAYDMHKKINEIERVFTQIAAQ